MSPRLAAWLDIMKVFRDEPAARATYFNADGSPKKLGDRVTNPALADTMQRIASEGAHVLQRGPIAEEMVARVRGNKRPGTLALSDLASYRPIKREPVCGPYRVWIVCSMPPPSSGGIALLQIAGAARTVRSCAGQAQRSAGAASDCRGGPARFRRPRTLRRRSGLRAGADRER